MKISRIHTTSGESPYAGVTFGPREYPQDPSAGNGPATGTIVAPESWSISAVKILATKYARRRGVPSATKRVDDGTGLDERFWRSIPADDCEFGAETDARQIFHRLAGCWTYWGLQQRYFDSADDAVVFYDEICAMLARQAAAPNSPQWFNTGLHWAYGIEGQRSGYYYTDHVTGDVLESPNLYEHPAPFACFINSIDDDLVNPGGIVDFVQREARIFKLGSGSGADFSKIRGKGEPLSGGGSSSGVMSFLKIGDSAAGAIKSGGTTRRAAKMVMLSADHPDVETFIGWKSREEKKVAALVAGSIALKTHLNAVLAAANAGTLPDDVRYDVHANPALKSAVVAALAAAIPQGSIQQVIDLACQGVRELELDTFDLGWESEAYLTVAGQNSNNSVRFPDSFRDALAADADWNLTWRTDGRVAKTLRATELFDDVSRAAWESADPGVLFDTTINDWHTVPEDGRINGCNPCAEYHSIDDSACNLASIRLTAFLTEDGSFEHERFSAVVRIWTLVLEISVSAGQLPSPTIAANTWRLRNLGLGYTDLGAMLMRMGIPYDSEDAFGWAAAVTALESGVAYRTSAEMAREQGPFASFERNRAAMLRVIANHARAAGVTSYDGPDGTVELGDFDGLSTRPIVYAPTLTTSATWGAARTAWADALHDGVRGGYRNSQVTVIAPAGTIGILMDGDTTGVEPDYALVKAKQLAGGGYLQIINRSVAPTLRRLGYREQHIPAMVTYVSGTRSLVGAPHVNPNMLHAKGFTDASIHAIETQLAGTFSLEAAFNMLTIAAADREVTGITDGILAEGKVLAHLGLSAAHVAEATDVVLGRGTLEGAPYFAPEHLPIFDTATPTGRSERFIRPFAHIDMLAAVQPFVSGSISKTINLPATATIADVREAYLYAWNRAVKAVALYRDGSKLSQPLAGGISDLGGFESGAAAYASPVQIAEKIVYRYLARQRKLPNKRGGYTQKFKIGGQKFYMRTGEYADGSLGEIFLTANREGATMRALLNIIAVAVSLGLQHGVPLEEFVDAFTFTRFEPAGPVIDHDNLKMCTSFMDAFFRDLAFNYLGRVDLAQIRPEDVVQPLADADDVFAEEADGDGRFGVASRADHGPLAIITRPSTNGHVNGVAHAVTAVVDMPVIAEHPSTDLAKNAGFTGETCTNCSSIRVVRTGACTMCLDCNSSTGCG